MDGGLNKILFSKIFFLFFITSFIFKANALTIYDNEIEVFIKDILSITYPKERALEKIQFTVILDDKPNAFVNQQNTIYLTTGILKYISSAEALIGVLAHEIGHLENFHISKRKKNMENLTSLDQFVKLTAIASSILSNNPELLLQTTITNTVGIRWVYKTTTHLLVKIKKEKQIYLQLIS